MNQCSKPRLAYDLPSSAPRIWFASGQVHLELPSTLASGQAHTVSFDDDLPGWARLKAILREREHSTDLRLALRGAPTQAQLPEYDPKKVRRVGKPKFAVAPGVAQAAREVMRRMGMI
jgi:hypothetical protein